MKHWSESYTNYNEVKKRIDEEFKEFPYMQTPTCGMHRKAEIILLLQIINEYMFPTYIEIGCGRGSFLKMVNNTFISKINLIGYDKEKPLASLPRNVNHIVMDNIFLHKEEISNRIKKAKGRVFIYCDNGNKIREIDFTSKAMKKGDVIGTHDYCTEVPMKSIDFLKERGFESINKYENWINTHLCLQKFWIKK